MIAPTSSRSSPVFTAVAVAAGVAFAALVPVSPLFVGVTVVGVSSVGVGAGVGVGVGSGVGAGVGSTYVLLNTRLPTQPQSRRSQQSQQQRHWKP